MEGRRAPMEELKRPRVAKLNIVAAILTARRWETCCCAGGEVGWTAAACEPSRGAASERCSIGVVERVESCTVREGFMRQSHCSCECGEMGSDGG